MGYLEEFEVALSRFRAGVAGDRGSLGAVSAKVEHLRGQAVELEGKVRELEVRLAELEVEGNGVKSEALSKLGEANGILEKARVEAGDLKRQAQGMLDGAAADRHEAGEALRVARAEKEKWEGANRRMAEAVRG